MKRRTNTQTSQAGFTIIELMMATVVFSVILLVITVGVLHFTNGYYKGLNASATQTATQNAIDTISQAIQFTATDSVGTDVQPGVFCAGDKQFVYTLGQEFSGTPSVTDKGLYMTTKSGTCADPGTVTGGTELLSKHMRITDISMVKLPPSPNPTNTGDIWQLSLKIAYGDSDLLCKTGLGAGTTGSCGGNSPFAPTANVSGNDVSCKSQIGSQFCTTAALTTVTQQRIVK